MSKIRLWIYSNHIIRLLWIQYNLINMEVIFKMLKASIFISSAGYEEKSTGSHIAREILLLLVNNLYEKRISETQNGRNFGSARALFVICTRVKTLHSCYMKNATVFSQSDARNFFMYVISAQIGLVITNHVPEFCFVNFD